MSDSQPHVGRDWYKTMQRKAEVERAAHNREIEQRVHAILGMEDMLTKACLCNQLIAAHPAEALEMLILGGHTDEGTAIDPAAGVEAGLSRRHSGVLHLPHVHEHNGAQVGCCRPVRSVRGSLDLHPVRQAERVEVPDVSTVGWIVIGGLGAVSVAAIAALIYILNLLTHMMDGW